MRTVVLLKAETKGGGGLEKYAKRIEKGFQERGDQVIFLTREKFGIAKGYPAFLKLKFFDRSVKKWLANHKTDLVFAMDLRSRFPTHIRAGNGVHAAYLETRVHTDTKLKQLTFRFNPLHRKILFFERSAFTRPGLQKIFANSAMVKQQILRYYPVDPSKIEVIHNGVEWFEMEPHWRVERRREPFHFLFIGNGYQRKGLDRLLEGLALLREKDFVLSVVGKEKQMGKYQHKAEKLGLGKRVRFFGPVKEILPFYQQADVLVIPSFYDPFANVTLEALAMGLFVISSKTNGASEILTEANGALIDDLQDLSAVQTALKKALQMSKTPSSALQIRRSVRHLDFSQQLGKLLDAC